VQLEYHKCNFPTTVDDWLQEGIFRVGLNDNFISTCCYAHKVIPTVTGSNIMHPIADILALLVPPPAYGAYSYGNTPDATRHEPCRKLHLPWFQQKASLTESVLGISIKDASETDPQAAHIVTHHVS